MKRGVVVHAVTISSLDQGVGIPKSDSGGIFQKAFRAGNVKKKKEGHGIGLYVTKTLVKKLGGEIWFKSVENKGTTFFFTLKNYKAKDIVKPSNPTKK